MQVALDEGLQRACLAIGLDPKPLCLLLQFLIRELAEEYFLLWRELWYIEWSPWAGKCLASEDTIIEDTSL